MVNKTLDWKRAWQLWENSTGLGPPPVYLHHPQTGIYNGSMYRGSGHKCSVSGTGCFYPVSAPVWIS